MRVCTHAHKVHAYAHVYKHMCHTQREVKKNAFEPREYAQTLQSERHWLEELLTQLAAWYGVRDGGDWDKLLEGYLAYSAPQS